MCNCNAITIKTQMTHTLEQLVHKFATEIQNKHINVTSKKVALNSPPETIHAGDDIHGHIQDVRTAVQ